MDGVDKDQVPQVGELLQQRRGPVRPCEVFGKGLHLMRSRFAGHDDVCTDTRIEKSLQRRRIHAAHRIDALKHHRPPFDRNPLADQPPHVSGGSEHAEVAPRAEMHGNDLSIETLEGDVMCPWAVHGGSKHSCAPSSRTTDRNPPIMPQPALRMVDHMQQSGGDRRSEPRPRVLLVCQKLPLPVLGGLDLRTLAIAKALTAMAEVHVVGLRGTTVPPPAPFATWETLSSADAPDSAQVFAGYLAHPTRPYAALFDPRLAERLNEVVSTLAPTHVIASRLQVWEYVRAMRPTWHGVSILELDEASEPLTQSLGRSTSPTVVARVQERINRALIRFEEDVVREADSVWVSSAIERRHVQRLHQGKPCAVIQNAVDVTEYAGGSRVHRDTSSPTVLFTGNFAYPPNQQAAAEIIHEVAPLLPAFQFRFAGSHQPAWLCAAQSDRIQVIGSVASMAREFARADMALFPIRAGGGTRLKVIEALASRTPIVATQKAIEGLGVTHGRHLLVAETSEQLAEAVVTTWTDADQTATRVDIGEAWVAKHHSIEALASAIQDQWES